MKVEKGCKIKVEYEGKLDDGKVFDSSAKHGKPLEFEVGAGQMIKGFDEAVVGMKKGDEKKITLKPEDAYGEHNPEMLKKMPRDQFPKEHEPKEGMVLVLGTPQGGQFPVKIQSVTDKEVELDLNHPLAGKTLSFTVKIVDVEKGK
ncbi:MAG: peptidylprolyl isomerase [Candidatus Woesearchaeota archaeon]|jgi:FKBP-type peptidyl-prolyl cis-trans isomerase 2|nr:peptidylprolyl isomerase [Candidatus Woesearchaeota archaeon]MDP7323309.1 peptidylprolyl isomerase [Candidatus Woesearchaeota archaeon]MDP7457824.1 peptidylprolyl isomerase [Candidatus Woesearchaeota archaeon]|tara:strand:- start:53 stop:490 length:438 start_codon:yes stop_codon:yes gene_type:complete